MDHQRLPWEVVETLPSTDRDLVERWDTAGAPDVRALVGRALSRYWATQEGVLDESWEMVAQQRREDVDAAEACARAAGDPELLAVALLGRLYALWGPDTVADRPVVLGELRSLAPELADEELRLRVIEWEVLEHLDAGRVEDARREVDRFARVAASTDLLLFQRREALWRGNLAVLAGQVDDGLGIISSAVAATAETAGTPFSFQNVAITVAIERFLRRGLLDTIDTIRSVRASSPRVGANWDTGLAFALSETGQLDEAAELFDRLAADGFAAVPRDLNWLVTMHLLGLVALHLECPDRCAAALAQLAPFAHLDATHGSGYASYGPVGRVVGSLRARCGDLDGAAADFDAVLATRSPGPWTSLTLLDRARELRGVDPARAAADARRAATELRDLGLDAWASVARELHLQLVLDGHGGPIAHRAGGTWVLRHQSGRAELPDGKGVQYLTELLARPGRAVPVAELDTELDPALPDAGTESTIDAAARNAYRRRLADLDRPDRTLGPHEEAEVDFLRRELAAGSFAASGEPELERARVRVTKAIRRAISAIGDQSPGLRDHLASSVHTGGRCLYAPADGIGWQIVRRDAR